MTYTRQFKDVVPIPAASNVNGATYTTDSKTLSLSGSRTGVRVDGWKERIRDGTQAGSPYSSDRFRVKLYQPSADSLVIKYQIPPFTGATNAFTGFIAAQRANQSLTHRAVSTSEARSKALTKLYKKLEAQNSHMNAPAFFAEVGDVIRQFGTPFEAIVKAIDLHYSRLAYEKSKLIGPLNYRRVSLRNLVARTWLETSFGLLPLISDAEKAAEALARFQFEDQLADPSSVVKARATVMSDTHTVLSKAPSGTYLRYSYTEKITTEARAQYIVGLSHSLRADFGSNERLLQLFGVDVRNVPLAIWEAVPWSWLMDYFTNVQAVLEAGAALVSNVSWIVLSETRKTTQELRVGKCIVNLPANWAVVDFTQAATARPSFPVGGIDVIRTTFNRTLPAELGVPPLYLKSPFGDPKKVANLLALMLKRKDEDSKLLLF